MIGLTNISKIDQLSRVDLSLQGSNLVVFVSTGISGSLSADEGGAVLNVLEFHVSNIVFVKDPGGVVAGEVSRVAGSILHSIEYTTVSVLFGEWNLGFGSPLSPYILNRVVDINQGVRESNAVLSDNLSGNGSVIGILKAGLRNTGVDSQSSVRLGSNKVSDGWGDIAAVVDSITLQEVSLSGVTNSFSHRGVESSNEVLVLDVDLRSSVKEDNHFCEGVVGQFKLVVSEIVLGHHSF